MAAGRRADVHLDPSASLIQFNGAGTNYVVQTPSGVLYIVYVDQNSDISYRKSEDGGLTWNAGAVVFAGTVTNLAVWYDRWSNISAGLIHMAYTESGTDDTLYRTINTESSDALSTQTVIFAGASTLAGGHLSITRSVGGNVYCKTVIDAGTEGGFFRLPTANVPNGAWDAARTVDETIATLDMMILLPDYDAADTQDILAIFWDASANEVSRKLYDDSGNSWAETSIAASMTEGTAATAFPHFAVAMDIANTRHYLVAWSAVDTANADLRFWTIDSGTITEGTNVVLNSTDDQGLAEFELNTDTGEITVFYAGACAGGETFKTAVNIYCKGSRDTGATWGAETALTAATHDIGWLVAIPRGVGPPVVAWHNNETINDRIMVNVDRTRPRAQSLVGIM